MKTSVCKLFRFEAAHFLPHYEGKCHNLHGHSWKLEVQVSGFVNPDSGMVLDFVYLKDLVNHEVVDKLDHTCLNEALVGEMEDRYGVVNPTCENLLDWIWKKLSPMGGWTKKIKLERLRLWETPDSYAELSSV